MTADLRAEALCDEMDRQLVGFDANRFGTREMIMRVEAELLLTARRVTDALRARLAAEPSIDQRIISVLTDPDVLARADKACEDGTPVTVTVPAWMPRALLRVAAQTPFCPGVLGVTIPETFVCHSCGKTFSTRDQLGHDCRVTRDEFDALRDLSLALADGVTYTFSGTPLQTKIRALAAKLKGADR